MLSTLKFVNDERQMLNIASNNFLLRDFLTSDTLTNYLAPALHLVSLSPNQVLYEQGDEIEYLYFPLNCVISVLGTMEDGTTVETAMVGKEGVVDIFAILGSGTSRQWTWVAISGEAVQIETKLLEQIFLSNETALKSLMHGYRSLVTQVSQRCICNTRHTIHERLCCWLLMIHDRVGGQDLRLTQETIASRIGARRAGITVAAGTLQGMGAIEYRRGHLHIIDREVLEEMACECYTLLKADFDGRSRQT